MRSRITTPDVIVIGGGVIGCAVAYYSTKQGLTVTVIDEGTAAKQASRVAAGLVAPSPQLTNPSPFADLALKSVNQLRQLQEELKDASGINIEYEQCGTLRIATSERQAETQQKRLIKQQHLGLNLQWLTAQEVLDLEPSLTTAIFGGVYGPNEGQLNALKLVNAYRKGAELQGATFLKDRVIGLNISRNNVAGVRTKTARMNAKQTVLTSGAWIACAGDWLGTAIPIEPERGQILTISNPKPKTRHIIFGEQAYLAPKHGNRIIVGASKDMCGYDAQPTVFGVEELLTKAVQLAPSLSQAYFRTARAGLRPRTPDGKPIIGAIPGWEGISMAAGHHSNGLLFSSLTGQMIAALLTHRKPPIGFDDFSIARFAD